MTEQRRVELGHGITLNVACAGDRQNPAVILLHGFPESHRTWREIVPALEEEFFLVMPDQRGFGRSERPLDVDSYRTELLVDDLFDLAGALDLESFALVGHDWGGAVAWAAALRRDSRLTSLTIINAPHPVIFQKSLIESDSQRQASQYIRAFRSPDFEKLVQANGFDWFFERTFGAHVDVASISKEERKRYLEDWSRPGALTAMLNWYRAAKVIVPPPGLVVPLPDWLLHGFPKVEVPTLVIWGMKDKALLPLQLEGLSTLVEDLSIVELSQAGHFAPWEAPKGVLDALAPFLARNVAARAPNP